MTYYVYINLKYSKKSSIKETKMHNLNKNDTPVNDISLKNINNTLYRLIKLLRLCSFYKTAIVLEQAYICFFEELLGRCKR